MQNFTIHENVPIEHHAVERAVGHIGALFSRLTAELGHKAVLAYARPFDEFNHTNYYDELKEQFSA